MRSLLVFTHATIEAIKPTKIQTPGGAMPVADDIGQPSSIIPVIDLSKAPGEHAAWDKPKIVIYLWAIVELLFVTNAWQISSGIRIRALRLFGAKIGHGVVFRPRTRVKFPWKLTIGDRSWIGEGVWIHNQDNVTIGSDVVISQESFITTGSHSLRSHMGLITSPIGIGDGVWITSRCIILGGTTIGTSTVLSPGSVAGPMATIGSNLVVKSGELAIAGTRFPNQ